MPTLATATSKTRNIPPLLEPYLSLRAEASLIVLTGIIGASTNWLVLRYLSSLLRPASAVEGGNEAETGVLLVSFMRDFAFWRDGAGRLGVDLPSLASKGRFGFVDGLTGLFADPPSCSSSPGASASAGAGGRAPSTSRTARRLIWDEESGLRGGVATTLHEAVDDLLHAAVPAASSPRKLVLVVDQPDLLLAATGAGTTVAEMRNLLLDLREKVHACIVTLSADEPLVSAAQQGASRATTLELEHASLALSLAHEASLVLSMRLLDTGAAGDVSGVLRITRGGNDDGSGGDSVAAEEHEYLYHVGGDGGVRVFERGQ